MNNLNNMAIADVIRFWSNVDIRGADECWIWQGSLNSNEYGQFSLGGRVNGRTVGAHRIAYESEVGAIPDGMQVNHHCDNRACVNPAHLWVGTKTDNSADMKRKGRGRGGAVIPLRGEENAQATLLEQQVHDIRRKYAEGGYSYRGLAGEYGVGRTAIGQIVRRETWTHI